MKQLFTLIFFFAVVKTFAASDTLTRAQVYDFSVGDTFDYKHYNYTEYFDPDPNPHTSTETDYSRFTINYIFYSPDSTTKYIQRQRLYPLPVSLDTLTLPHISGQEVYLDTTSCFTSWGASSITIDSTSQFNNEEINIINQYLCGGSLTIQTLLFAPGIGNVLDFEFSGASVEGFNSWDTTELIHYSRDTITWGTPYYDFPTAVQQLSSADGQITLFPTVNEGTFNVKISDEGLLPVNFAVYDITGREIKRVVLNNASNSVNLENCSAGLYIWQAITQDELMQTGKMVIH